MHKIDSDGATIDFKFTEGSVVLSVPATVVSAAWANAVQGELVTVIEAAGITLLTSGTDTEDQLLAAIQTLIGLGGAASPITQTVANNQASPADVDDFPIWLSTAIVGHEFYYRVFRRTDTQHVVESGRCYVTYDPEDDDFYVTKQGSHDDSEVNFSVITTGNADEYKLQYDSSNLTGASYSGELKIIDVKTILA